jgi:flagellar protein FlgJ
MTYSYQDKINFIKSLYCPARLVSDETGASWELILSQAAGETGWGEKTLPGTNNIFNIKADSSWSGPSKVFNVPEVIHGKTVHVNAPFRVYATILDSLRDRQKFLKENPRYAKAGLYDPGTKGNLEGEASALQKAGYATDPDYATKLATLFNGKTMKRAIAEAQKEGCGPILPAMEIFFLDAAKVAIRGAKINITLGDKSMDASTNDAGSFHIRIAPKTSGNIQLKLYDEDHKKWLDLDPVAIPSPVTSKLVTVIAPTFTVHSNTAQHVKETSSAKKDDAPPTTNHAGAKEVQNYTVKKGDTLYLIGKQFSVRYKTIAELNGIQSPYVLRVGQVLKLPKSGGAATPSVSPTPSPSAAAPSAAAPVASTAAVAPASQTGSSAANTPVSVPHKSLDEVVSKNDNLHTNYHRNESDVPQTDVMLNSKAPWMIVAEEQFKLGVKRHTDKTSDQHIVTYFDATSLKGTKDGSTDKTAYCAAFANWCLVQKGIKGTGNAMATSFKNWGRATKGNKPAFGAVAIVQFPCKKGETPQHHVTFVTGINPGDKLATLGGNQGHAHEVSHSALPLDWVVAYRYPSDYPHYDEDYALHPVKCDSASMSGKSTH